MPLTTKLQKISSLLLGQEVEVITKDTRTIAFVHTGSGLRPLLTHDLETMSLAIGDGPAQDIALAKRELKFILLKQSCEQLSKVPSYEKHAESELIAARIECITPLIDSL